MTVARWVGRIKLFGLYAFAVALPFNLWTMQAALGVVALALAVESLLGRARRTLAPRGSPDGSAPRMGAPSGLVAVWPRALVAPVAMYVAAILLSWLGGGGAPDLSAALGFWPVFASLVLAAAVPDARTALRLWTCVIVMSALMGLYGVLQHFTGADVFRVHTHIARAAPLAPGRFLAIGNFETHTTYAFSLAFPALVAAAWALSDSFGRLARAAYASAAALVSAGLVFSYVRSIWLGLFAGLFVMALLRRGAALKLLVLLCVVGGLTVVAVPSLRERARSVVDVQYNVGRAYIWERSWQMLVDHPGSGIGFGRYRALQAAYFDEAAPPAEVPRTGAHSTYLHLAVELGLLGLAAFVWLWLRVFGVAFVAFRRLRSSRGAPAERVLLFGGVGALACFLWGSFFQESYFDGEVAFMLWFTVATVFVGARPPAEPTATS